MIAMHVLRLRLAAHEIRLITFIFHVIFRFILICYHGFANEMVLGLGHQSVLGPTPRAIRLRLVVVDFHRPIHWHVDDVIHNPQAAITNTRIQWFQKIVEYFQRNNRFVFF